MIQRSLVTLAILFLGASAASAQGLAHWRSAKKDLEARRLRSLPSPAEIRYLDELALNLGVADEAGLVGLAYGLEDLAPRPDPSSGSRARARARGVWAKVGGLEVLRFRFPSEDHAQRFAIYAAETEGHPTLLEVRGKQLVIARGERLRDPDELQRIRRAAWGVLPHAPGAPSVAGLTLSRGEHAYELRIPNADLDQLIDGAFEEEGVDEGHTLTQRWRGHASQVARFEDRKTLWVARGRAAEGSPKIKALAGRLFETSQRLAQGAEAPQASRPRSQTRYQSRSYQSRSYQSRSYRTNTRRSDPARTKPLRSGPTQSESGAREAKPRARREGIRDALEKLERVRRVQEALRRLEPKRLSLQ
jgi:hypothetical protein